ncbi:bifunctional cytidylyltransferase/SDR family oxidoreductase [Halosquirtibacter laminarini]|uniref:Bifunctional cytidylyltransferase/SDR family oxidoreductase n=1 Tax=Halosquirtibacter laminarini TaxID=3374600 RepID=A0AC61NE53_9BACT|nr:bifunctional cytidylyltransferase/SDR family oxidoreductase [Prolixibacteraceae bacterium]
MRQNIAVILAGGIGNRMNSGLPKQLMKLAGKTVLEHTLGVFEKHESIDSIFIVSNKQFVDNIESILCMGGFKKVNKILIGGKERSDSSLAAINACENEDSNLIFHDAVRPLLNSQIINDVIAALDNYNAVDVVIPCSDTIVEVDNEKFISNIPNRNKLRKGQTPQGFKCSTIREAYEIGLKDPKFIATDDCGIVNKYLPNEKIAVVSGSISNHKLTYKEDLFLLDKLFQLKSITGIDVSDLKDLKGKVICVFGGSYGIGAEIVKEAKEHGAITYQFSRKSNGVNIKNFDAVERSLEEVFNKEGRIDAVINCAALLRRIPISEMAIEDMKEIVDVNLIGALNIAKSSFKFLKQSKGVLLLFTSSSYTLGRKLYSVYSSTKCANVNLMQALAEEWADHKIRVNSINPERTATPMRKLNFGNEDPDSLLSANKVATITLGCIMSKMSGQVIDVKLDR